MEVPNIVYDLTKENPQYLSGKLFPRVLNAKGGAVALAGAAAFGIAASALKGHNSATLGKVTYTDGPARMTKPYTTGAVPAMLEASQGDYQAFSGMAKNVVKGHHNVVGSVLDDYGADAKLISALYNMHS